MEYFTTTLAVIMEILADLYNYQLKFWLRQELWLVAWNYGLLRAIILDYCQELRLVTNIQVEFQGNIAVNMFMT